MKPIIILFLVLAPIARAQYANSVNPNAGGLEMNGKPNFQVVAGNPNGNLSGTAGKDLAFDTVGIAWYLCSATGTATTAIWAKVPPTTVGGDLTGTLPNPTIASNVVTSAKMAVVNTRKTICNVVGADNGSVLVDADLSQGRQYFINAPSTVVELTVTSDGGSPSVTVGRERCTTFTTGTCSAYTVTNLTSSALASSAGFQKCSNTGGTIGLDAGTTCSNTLTTTSLAAGDWISLVSGTAGGTAKRMTICATFTTN